MNPVHEKTLKEYFGCQVPYKIRMDTVIEYRGFRLVPRNDNKFPLRQVLEIIDQIEYPLRILPQPIAEEIGEYATPLMTANTICQFMQLEVNIDMEYDMCMITLKEFSKNFYYGRALIRHNAQLTSEALKIMARLPHQTEKIDMSALPADLVKEIEDSGWAPELPYRFDAGYCEYAVIFKNIAFYDYEGDYTVLYGESYNLEDIILGILDHWGS